MTKGVTLPTVLIVIVSHNCQLSTLATTALHGDGPDSADTAKHDRGVKDQTRGRALQDQHHIDETLTGIPVR